MMCLCKGQPIEIGCHNPSRCDGRFRKFIPVVHEVKMSACGKISSAAKKVFSPPPTAGSASRTNAIRGLGLMKLFPNHASRVLPGEVLRAFKSLLAQICAQA